MILRKLNCIFELIEVSVARENASKTLRLSALLQTE